MIRFNFSKLVAVVALIAVLGMPLASTAAPRTTPGPFATPSAVPTALAWLQSLFTRAWTKNGCRIDPNGVCVPIPLPVSHDGEPEAKPQPVHRHAD